jgi:hypothetical protein
MTTLAPQLPLGLLQRSAPSKRVGRFAPPRPPLRSKNHGKNVVDQKTKSSRRSMLGPKSNSLHSKKPKQLRKRYEIRKGDCPCSVSPMISRSRMIVPQRPYHGHQSLILWPYVLSWDLSEINPNRLKFLAQFGRRATSQALQRLAPRAPLSDPGRFSAPVG